MPGKMIFENNSFDDSDNIGKAFAIFFRSVYTVSGSNQKYNVDKD